MNWNYPTNIWFGEGKIEDLVHACLNLNIKSPLFVTDKDLLNLPMTSKIIEKLKIDFESLNVFSKFTGNPTGKNVTEGVSFYIEKNCDGVIAFGGGSALDVGKGIAFMCGQKLPIWDFEDIGDYWTRADESKISPIIAVPTTAGTGSETGRASAIINEETGIKKIIFHPKILPSIVILDPNLTKELPPRITAATGMDALAHNLEAFCATGFHPMADGIALEGMRLIKNSLIEVYKNGKNIKARSEMLAASSMGSTAFQKGLGAIHSLSHPINAQFDVHHGLTNAIFMPYVLTFNRSVIENKIVSICNYLNLNNTFESFLEWILNLREDLNIPHKLSDVMECNEINLDKLSLMAFEDPSTGSNPKKITQEDLKEIYNKSISGELF